MSTDLIDLTADIVIAHASVTEMSSNDLLKEIKKVYATLEALTRGGKALTLETSDREQKVSAKNMRGSAIPQAPAMTIEEAFKPDQVACMICGKTGMKTLKRHIASAHDLKPGQYKKLFKIDKDQPLAALEYVEQRRRIALERGLGEKLAAARAAKKNKQMGE
ncbi:MAG: MucR family transcriptional regulator [Deltaproteobacteria bacterium]|nr:MAG: MucR family transcriptional regulator [Deltaproteobacteria bacterium]